MSAHPGLFRISRILGVLISLSFSLNFPHSFRNSYSGSGLASETAGDRQPTSQPAGGTTDFELLGRTYGSSTILAVYGKIAYLNEGTWLRAIDVSDPSQPRLVGSLSLPWMPEKMTLYHQYGYVLGKSLRVLDLSMPAQPHDLGDLAYLSVYDFAISKDAMYVAGYDLRVPCGLPPCSGSLLRLDLASDPQAPPVIGSYTVSGYFYGWADRVVAAGDTLYYRRCEDYKNAICYGYQSLDFSDPAHPLGLGAVSGQVYAVQEYGDDLLVADGDLRIVAATDRATLTPLVTYATAGETTSLGVLGSLVYLASPDKGLDVVDISDPTQPVFVLNYPYKSPLSAMALEGGYLYLAFENDGLWINSDPADTSRFDYHWGAYVIIGDMQAIATQGDWAFTSGSQILNLIDIQHPAEPRLLTRHIRSGFVALSGDQAYSAGDWFQIMDWGGLWFWDLGHFPLPTIARDMLVQPPYAYIANDVAGLQIIDMNDPLNAYIHAHLQTVSIALSLAQWGTYLYLATSQDGILLIDVSNPISYQYLGYLLPPKLSGCVGDLTPVPQSVSTGQGILLVALSAQDSCGFQLLDYYGLAVYDLADPAAPRLSALIQPLPAAPGKFAIGGDYAYTQQGSRIAAFDLTQPLSPSLSSLGPDLSAAVQGVSLNGGQIFAVAGPGGLVALHHGQSISGRVLLANGSPVANASLSRERGLRVSSDAQGQFHFDYLAPVAHHLVPENPPSGQRFIPAQREVPAADHNIYAQDFTLLPAPVSTTFPAGVVARLVYTDTLGLATQFVVPAQTPLTTTLTVTPTLASSFPGWAFTGHAFVLQASPSLAVGSPLTVTISTGAYDLHLVQDRSQLELLHWDGATWAQDGCVTNQDYAQNRTFSASLCAPGAFALFGPTHNFFLPVFLSSPAQPFENQR